MKRRCGRTWVIEPTTKNRAGEFVTNWASVGVVYMQFYGDAKKRLIWHWLQIQANFFGAPSGIENPQTSVLPADAFTRSLTRNFHLERSA